MPFFTEIIVLPMMFIYEFSITEWKFKVQVNFLHISLWKIYWMNGSLEMVQSYEY